MIHARISRHLPAPLGKEYPRRCNAPFRAYLATITAVLAMWSSPSADAQDIHFSQFFNTPLALGPASIGAFDGQQRISAVFRQQWRSVTVPYRTFGLGADLADAAGVKGLGLGAWIYNDRAGDSRMDRFHFSMGASWSIPITTDRVHNITAGIQFGLSSITLDQGALSFDAQYNGFTFDPQRSTGEAFVRDGLIHTDLHTGALYRYRPAARRLLQVGLSVFNLTRPRIGFLGDAGEPLDPRSTLHLISSFPITAMLDLRPMVQFITQGTFTEFDLGADVRYILLERYGTKRALIAGLFYRALDAGYMHVGLEYDDWTAGVSYDLNTSELVPASRNRGGIEFTVIRILRKRQPLPVHFKACPEQL